MQRLFNDRIFCHHESDMINLLDLLENFPGLTVNIKETSGAHFRTFWRTDIQDIPESDLPLYKWLVRKNGLNSIIADAVELP